MGHLDRDGVEAIDRLRSRGATYDEVAAGLTKKGVSRDHVHAALEEYGELRIPDGRKRSQVNPGDPHEQGAE